MVLDNCLKYAVRFDDPDAAVVRLSCEIECSVSNESSANDMEYSVDALGVPVQRRYWRM